MNSLRQELLRLPGLPTMRMLIPAGWRSLPLTDEHLSEFTRKFSEILMRAHRPDLDAELTAMLERWAKELRGQGGRFAILPLDRPEGSVLPMSLTVSIVSELGGRSLDEWVAARIRQGGTDFLDDARTVLFWEGGASQGNGLNTRARTYLIPVPGTRRGQAVLLSGIELVAEDEPADGFRREAASMLFDSVALALDWLPAA
ncbi:MAG: hypothetical protein QM630_02805 [Microbacterium sp.]